MDSHIFCKFCNSSNIFSSGKTWGCKDCGRYFSKSPKKSDSSWHQWNKGLSKETDVRVKNYSEKQSLTKKNNLEFIKKAIANLPPSKIDTSKEKLEELYKSNTQKDISKILDCSQSRIGQLFKEYNIESRSNASFHTHKLTDIGKQKLQEKMKGNINWTTPYRFPNKEERKLLNFINNWNLPFKYVGDGSFRIDGKCPDFVNEKERFILELFGELWHPITDEKNRINFFKERGWKCLVIWVKEIRGKRKGQYHKGDFKWEQPLYDRIVRWMAGLE